ncbi:MAG: alpha amylase C-terminal domain-containing protein [Desulfobacterales bacterium]|nr:alpha amylase C-terminal domain-containing protein [Desulfobacterales bacterium]
MITQRSQYIVKQENNITDNSNVSLYDTASYHLFFGLHPLYKNKKLTGWIFREWAPNASAVYIIGTMTDWKIDEQFKLLKKEPLKNTIFNCNGIWERYDGIWEKSFDREAFKHGGLYRLKIFWDNSEEHNNQSNNSRFKNNSGGNGSNGDRIPTCAARVVQDPETLIFNAQVWNPETEYKWKNSSNNIKFNLDIKINYESKKVISDKADGLKEPLLIYESHIGMAQEEGKIGTYQEFEQNILPRIKDAGYNAVQLMAVQEHPYYGSFGYHVSNFFAPSSRFGTPDELKSLIDSAHEMGLKVIMDIVHSHAVINEVEGLSRFDGTLTQFFHDGERGLHKLWGSRCFDYSKAMVIKFLLSNCRYWIEEYHVDGFRFDGITSMIYKDHGINRAFTTYKDYFEADNDKEADLDALAYLYLANKLIHQIMPNAITIAEDVSGYPGLAASQSQNTIFMPLKQDDDQKNKITAQNDDQKNYGIGFDYRFSMGIADFWIKLIKEHKDEDWDLSKLWYELNAKREDEKTISYAESHDQALVGDQTIMMRLMGEEIYSSMSIDYETHRTFRGAALHKMIRLITLASAGDGYLNFMGNEFGHPEWIDFPGKHNNWSFHFARRQWSLKDNKELYFSMLAEFDKNMINLAKDYNFIGRKQALLHIHQDNKIIAFQRAFERYDQYNQNENHNNGNLIFIFNFNPLTSFKDYLIDAPAGKYKEILNSDNTKYGGKGRAASGQIHFTQYKQIDDKDELDIVKMRNCLSLYLPTRSAVVLMAVD